VECYAGYDVDGSRVTEQVNPSHFVTDNGTKLTHDHLLNYASNLIHAEEKQAVLLGCSVKFDVRSLEKMWMFVTLTMSWMEAT